MGFNPLKKFKEENSKTNNEDKLQKRADILYNNTEKKNNNTKKSGKMLGESITDEEETENENIEAEEIKSNEDKNSKDNMKEVKENSENKNDRETSKDKTKKTDPKQKNYDEVAELFYPEMKNKTADDKEISENEPVENTNENENNLDNTKQEIKAQLPNANDKMQYKKSLRNYGLNDNDFIVEGNTITPKPAPKPYRIETINNLKFPSTPGNETVERIRAEAIKERSKKISKENERYLRFHAIPKQIAIDHINNPIVKEISKFITKTDDESVENLHMAKTKYYMNTPYAKKHKIYNSYNEVPDNFKEYFKNKITQQIGKENLEKTKGIFIDVNSKSSESLKNALIKDSNFINKLKKYNKAMNKNYFINESINFEDNNWQNAVGHADIKNMHINKDGDVELYITDVYDFNEGEKNDVVRAARNRQEKGKITPYFSIYRVIIPKEEKNAILNQK